MYVCMYVCIPYGFPLEKVNVDLVAGPRGIGIALEKLGHH